ncbi:hypothetical protein [Streptomyces sp. NPDC017520]|uniref:hypothetical protein n=1 Tax=Streptomyces sp. NPDC017520 TaxID=3364998 RepID=UPI0037A895D6
MLGKTMLAAFALAAAALTVPVALPDAQAVSELPQPVHLSNDDAGKTFDVTVGDQVTVKLQPVVRDGLEFTWEAPMSSDEAVLASRKPDEDDESGTSNFEAVAEGTADLIAVVSCKPVDADHVCPEDVDPWKATVTVTAKEPAPEG